MVAKWGRIAVSLDCFSEADLINLGGGDTRSNSSAADVKDLTRELICVRSVLRFCSLGQGSDTYLGRFSHAFLLLLIVDLDGL